MKESFNDKSRSLVRSKRRKTNLILNSLIIIVLLLIIFVSVRIFFGNDETAGEKKTLAGADSSIIKDRSETVSVDKEADKVRADENEQDREKTSAEEDESSEQNKKDKQTDQDEDKTKKDKATDKEKDKADKEKDKTDAEDQEVVTEGGSGPDVNKTIVNPAWEPLETAQANPNPNEYGGQNWNEMVQAITYATGIDESNMTILFLGNNGPNKSVGTILQKDTKQKYRVYIDWVEGSGWQPTSVEELNG